jgi:hypothetical protein
MPGVGLVESKPLYYLENVSKMNLRDNNIQDFKEHVVPILMTVSRLDQIILTGNPVVKQTPKFRD